MQDLVARAVRWHERTLRPEENLASCVTHVAGPALHVGVHNPTRFHTYACLYPDLGHYVAMNTGDWDDYPGCTISAVELREVIASLTMPPDKIQQQQAAASEYLKPGVTDEQRWMMAVECCAAFRLPIGMLMVGTTVATTERVVYMQSMVTAPLDRVVSLFKSAAPRLLN